MQRAALLLSGAGATAAGQRRGPRAAPPALSPGGARALHDVPRAAVRVAPGDARGRVRLRRVGRGGRRRRQEHQQELQHRRPETEGQKARGGAGTVTPGVVGGTRGAHALPAAQHKHLKGRSEKNYPRTIFMFSFFLSFFLFF